MPSAVWISYDLGIDGDYDGLFFWLDKHHAKECGDATAFFLFTVPQNRALPDALLRELRRNVRIRPKDRVYVIYPFEGKYKGRFICGHRKRAPWEGAAGGGEGGEDES